MINLGNSLKKARQAQHLMQKQIAEGIGITEQAYQKYEYAKNIPSAVVLIDLADYLDVSLDYLVGRSDDPTRR